MPAELQLPAILDFPDKLLPIITDFNKYQYFLIEGGRVSGKSQSVCRLIVYIGAQKKVNVVFGREIQKNIEESVYALVKEIIEQYDLAYAVGAKSMSCQSTGTQFAFRGFREQNKISIKGLEGVDILVIDEAQQIAAETLKIIIPTIRKPKSKIFFMMNRTLKDDPVYVEMKDRPDCLHIKINYHENKHCPQKSKDEAEEQKRKNIEDYNHIWLGEPYPQSNMAAFRDVRYIVDKDLAYPIPAEDGVTYTLGVDLARSLDYTVLTVLNNRHKRVDWWERMENENKTSWAYQKEKIKAVSKMYNNALAVVDSSGVGDPIVEDLQRMGVNVYYQQKDTSDTETPGVKFTSISKEQLIEKLKIAIEMRLIIIPQIPILIDELERFEARIMPSGQYRYAAPEGKHDDCVISLALALWGTHDMIYKPGYAPPTQKTSKDYFWDRVKKDTKKFDVSDSGEHTIDDSEFISIGEEN